ncbi:MAG: DNA polymerase III subunit gamma/tau, partial [Verrucomicrobiota bacterium]|nr:DNA polymerase III subunit gamma/tau [Verrucomicrobiota bacterium]
LETIRSRCLNFRIPSQVESIEHSNWEDWAIDYRAWLGRLLKGPSKESVPHIMLGAYGLISRFHSILTEATKHAWAEQKKQLAEHVSNDEKEAMEIGLSRSFRKQLYGEIESLTAGFCRDIEVLNPGRLPVNTQIRVIQALENSAGLLELNLNEATALELFFLKSLRLWTAK